MERSHAIYRVIINGEQQYSVWPANRDLQPGWQDTGKNGSKDECLAYIQEVWIDMRPSSQRGHIDQSG
jgi:MbtH protein